jgi:hydrogenase/urease accessory protein HupE
MFRRFLQTAAIAAFLLACAWPVPAPTASAHPFNNGYSDVRVEKSQVYYSLFLPAAGLTFIDTDKDGTVSPDELSRGRSEWEDYVSAGIQLDSGDFPMDKQVIKAEPSVKEGVPGVTTELLFTEEDGQPVDSLLIHYNLLFDDIDPSHLNFVTIHDGDDLDQYLFEYDDREYAFDHPTRLSDTIAVYLKLGIKHILSGTDHLVFLLSLLLVASRWKDVLAMVTAFTVSHSITLGLAASGYLPVSPRLVEAGIALSICYVAAGNPFVRRPERRWVPALLLGLIHGLGFAGALGETGLPPGRILPSLVAFNLGVELGQLALVLLLLPLLLRLRRESWYPRWVITGGSAVIFLIGLYWFIQRIGIV